LEHDSEPFRKQNIYHANSCAFWSRRRVVVAQLKRTILGNPKTCCRQSPNENERIRLFRSPNLHF
jgi:hypothetical protein